MKKSIAMLLCALMFLCAIPLCSHAEESEMDDEWSALSEMSEEELLSLRARIDEQLAQKGYSAYYDIAHGEKGEAVLRIQTRLNELGYYDGLLNGKYDSQTQLAVKQFQKSAGLSSDGTATIQTQTLLFSDDAPSKPTPTPRVTAAPTPTKDPAYTEYGDFDYTEASRYPETYMDKRFILTGTVVQVVSGSREKGFELRVATAGSYEDVVYVTVPAGLEFNILQDDRLTLYVTMRGTITYTSTLGLSITIPCAQADHVSLR